MLCIEENICKNPNSKMNKLIPSSPLPNTVLSFAQEGIEIYQQIQKNQKEKTTSKKLGSGQWAAAGAWGDLLLLFLTTSSSFSFFFLLFFPDLTSSFSSLPHLPYYY